jgi:hypothetical protein
MRWRKISSGPILVADVSPLRWMVGDAQGVTMDLYLDIKETELLTGLLERYLEDIRREIHHTDRAQFKAALKSDEALMRNLLQRLRVPVPMGI